MAVKLKHGIELFSKYFGNVLSSISGTAQMLFVLMVFAQVLLRYVFNSTSLFGIEELELYPIFWIYFIGGCLTSCEKTHIECGLSRVVFKKETVIVICDIIKVLLSAFLAVTAALCLYKHFGYIVHFWKKTSYWGAPAVLYEGMTFVGFAVMALLSVRDIVEFFLELRISSLRKRNGEVQQ